MKRNILCSLITLFCLAFSVVAQEATSANNVRGYLVGPGDVIEAKVLDDESFSFTATVDENGNIEAPYLEQPVPVMCRSEKEIRAEMIKLLSKFLKAPQISLSVKERKSRPPVTVFGEVGTQGQVTLTRQTRLWELITFSGGITDNAGGTIQVYRNQPPICASLEEVKNWQAEKEASKEVGMYSRLYSISTIQQGSDEANPIIYPGDIINVQRAKPVYIVGEVRGGGGSGLMLKEGGLPLTRAIAMVGGVNREAKSKEIKIYRQKPNSLEKEIISANLDLIKKNQQKDIMLEPYDIIEVDKAKPGILSTVFKTLGGALGSAPATLITGGTSRILY